VLTASAPAIVVYGHPDHPDRRWWWRATRERRYLQAYWTTIYRPPGLTSKSAMRRFWCAKPWSTSEETLARQAAPIPVVCAVWREEETTNRFDFRTTERRWDGLGQISERGDVQRLADGAPSVRRQREAPLLRRGSHDITSQTMSRASRRPELPEDASPPLHLAVCDDPWVAKLKKSPRAEESSRSEARSQPGPLTQQELEARLWAAANSLRGPVDPADFKSYVFPLLFFKWVSDTWDLDHGVAVANFGADIPPEVEADYHRFAIPQGCHWSDLQKVSTNVGVALQKILDRLAEANPQSLAGIFGDVAWGNKERLPEPALLNLIDAFDRLTLNRNGCPRPRYRLGDSSPNTRSYRTRAPGSRNPTPRVHKHSPPAGGRLTARFSAAAPFVARKRRESVEPLDRDHRRRQPCALIERRATITRRPQSSARGVAVTGLP
jgi:hypothetical protein